MTCMRAHRLQDDAVRDAGRSLGDLWTSVDFDRRFRQRNDDTGTQPGDEWSMGSSWATSGPGP